MYCEGGGSSEGEVGGRYARRKGTAKRQSMQERYHSCHLLRSILQGDKVGRDGQ